MNIGIIGCGGVGRKRAITIQPPHRLMVACDTDLDRAKSIAQAANALATTDYHQVSALPEVDLVVVATHNALLLDVALDAVRHGKHVLLEKPCATRAADLLTLQEAAAENGVVVKAGFNHRFHPALQRAKQIVDSGEDGEILFIRGRYGHGGRLGYEREWRSDPSLSGGGETLDQGVHLIDLSRWFMGDFPTVEGFAATYFWDAPVDDNGFLSLRTQSGHAAWLHVSSSEWKNLFSFEIYLRRAKLAIDGLGGSYGVERLAYYRMLPEMGPPETTIYEYPMGDRSWGLELEAAIAAATSGAVGIGADLSDAYAALKIVEAIYGRD